MMKAYLGVFLAGTALFAGPSTVKAYNPTYIYIGNAGFLTNNPVGTSLDFAANITLGTLGDPASVTGKEQNILSTDMRNLSLNADELATLSAIYDNLGVRQSAAGQHANTALLDQAIKFGDINDQTLRAAMAQAEKLGLDPNAMQALGQTVYSTAKLQVFDETLRAYEMMGGASLGLQERQALKAQVDTLNADQVSWEMVNNMARERLKASDAQKKQLAQKLGRQVVQSAARQGVVLEGEWEEYAPPWNVAPSPGLYDYAELGGMVSLHNPSGSEYALPTEQEKNPFANPNPLVGTGSVDPNASGAFPHSGMGANADPSTLPTGSFRGDTNAALRQIGTYNVGYDRSKNGWCARGVSKTLEAYSGMPITARSGANAKHMGPILQNKFGMVPVTDTGVYRNGDTRVLQNRGAGHIETYFNGTWSSDHVQRGPSTGNPRYSSAQLYRFP
jgi:hypothetical protein